MGRAVRSARRPTSWLHTLLAKTNDANDSRWEGRAKGLRDQRSMFSCGICDYYVAVYPTAQFTTENIDRSVLPDP
jgi:hypothetical protein